MPLDLLTIGDSSIDLFMQLPAGAGISEDTKNGLARMCFYHGSKIMVDGFHTSISGNSINVGVGAKMLGLNVSVYSEIGDDTNAERIKSELDKRGVDTKFLIKNKNTDTALHTVIVFDGERTIFSYHGKRNYKIQDWPQPKFIYYSSLGEGFEDFQKDLVDYIKSNSGVGLAFNPGTFQMAKGIEALKNILAVCDILFVNAEEAQALTNNWASIEMTELHKSLQSLGPKLTVITNGAQGASAFDGREFLKQEIISDQRPVVDKTGAGDAFSAGFLSAILYGKKLNEALKWGAANSGAQIKVIGPVDGMLTRDELEKLI